MSDGLFSQVQTPQGSDDICIVDPADSAVQEIQVLTQAIHLGSEQSDNSFIQADALQRTHDALGPVVDDGGLSLAAAAALSVATELLMQNLTGPKAKFPAMESFGGTMSLKAGTEATMETLRESLDKAWEYIKKLVAKLVQWIKDLFTGRLFKTKSEIRTKVSDLDREIEAFNKTQTDVSNEDASDNYLRSVGAWVNILYNPHLVASGEITHRHVVKSYKTDVTEHSTYAYVGAVKELSQCLEMFKASLTDKDSSSEEQAIETAHQCFKQLAKKALIKKGGDQDVAIINYALSGEGVELRYPSDNPHKNTASIVIPYAAGIKSKPPNTNNLRVLACPPDAMRELITVAKGYLSHSEFDSAVEKLSTDLNSFIQDADKVMNSHKGIDAEQFKRVDRIAKQAYNYTKAALHFFSLLANEEIKECNAVCAYISASLKHRS